MPTERSIQTIFYNADGLRGDAVEEEFGLLIKAVVLGNIGVGKRSFSDRLRYGQWNATRLYISVDFAVKRLTSTGSAFPEDVKLQIWETAGQERFGRLPASLTRGATVWYLCFEHRPTLDLSDAESIAAHCQDALAQLEPWFEYLSTASALYPAPVLPILLGLKSDVLPRSATRRGSKDVVQDDGLENFNRQLCAMANQAICSTIHISELFHPLRCFHVSSKTNESVDELLQHTADTIRAIFHRFPRGISSTASTYSSGLPRGAVRLPPLGVPPSSSNSARRCSC